MGSDMLEGIIAIKLSDVTDALVALDPAQRMYSELSKLIVYQSFFRRHQQLLNEVAVPYDD